MRARGPKGPTLDERRAANLPRALALLAECVERWEGAPSAPVVVGVRDYLAGVEGGRPARLCEVLSGLRGLTEFERRTELAPAAEMAFRLCRSCGDAPRRALRRNACEACYAELGEHFRPARRTERRAA